MTTRRNNQNWLPDVFNDFFDNEYLPKANATAPAINVIEKENKKEDKKEDGKYLRREFYYSQFHQELILPDDVDKDKITASVNNGVLAVVLPKVSQEDMKKESKVIDIK